MALKLPLFLAILNVVFSVPAPDPDPDIRIDVKQVVNGGDFFPEIPEANTISFEEHVLKFNLEFENEAEEQKRRRIFEDKVQKVNDHNKLYSLRKTSYKKGLNQFSHLTHEEVIRRYTGFNASDPILGQTIPYIPKNVGTETSSIDWVWRGIVNPIQDQGDCRSCWAFSATCAIESQIAKKYGVKALQKLSEQYLVDCDTGARGCYGGLPNQAITFVINNGIALASGYPYTGSDGTCNNAAPKTSYKIISQQHISEGKDADLLNACYLVSPISVAIVTSSNFRDYSSGVFTDPLCTGVVQADHAVVVVGYGTDNGQDYWLVRNSWGTSWGDAGYIKMTRSVQNFCLISTYAYIPTAA